MPAFEGSTSGQESGLGRARSITTADENDLRSALFEIQETLHQNISFSILGNTVMAHKFSDDVIEGIVSEASHIFDIEYLIEHHNITSMQLARDIVEIFSDQLADIDVSADAMFWPPKR